MRIRRELLCIPTFREILPSRVRKRMTLQFSCCFWKNSWIIVVLQPKGSCHDNAFEGEGGRCCQDRLEFALAAFFLLQFLNSCLENTLQIHARVYKLQRDNRVPGTDSKLQFQGLAAARRSRVVLFEKYEAASTALATRA